MLSFGGVITCYHMYCIECTVVIEQGIWSITSLSACDFLPISNEHQPNLHSEVFHKYLGSSGKALI